LEREVETGADCPIGLLHEADGINSRATNGKATNTVASTIPGKAKMIWTPWEFSQSPNNPCAPNMSTRIKPDTTGEMENGSSMRVMSRLLPLKRACVPRAAARMV
jgi:hypothetical protein